MGHAAAAVRVPAVDVPRRRRVGPGCAAGGTSPLAADRAERRDRGRALASANDAEVGPHAAGRVVRERAPEPVRARPQAH